MTPLEQTLLYLTSIVILLGTLTVFVVQFVRGRRRGGPGGGGPGGDGRGYRGDR
ncbi:hypothetical protein [Microbacterium lacticum]